MDERLSGPHAEASRAARDGAPRSRGRGRSLLRRIRAILESTATEFIASDSLTRGAAIAFYSVTSLIPVLVIVIAIAGLVFGESAARGAVARELAALIGVDGATPILGAVESACHSGANGFELAVRPVSI